MWKIVLVDDDRNIIRSMKKLALWQEMGIEIVGEGLNGKRGLEVILDRQPDIVLADVYMPDLNGLEMIQQLRKSGFGGKIVILSGYSDFDYARQALRLQVDDYLSKPVTLDTIRSTFTRVTDQLREELARRNQQEQMEKKLLLYEPFYQEDPTEESGLNARHKQAVAFIIAYVQEHYAEEITLADLAEQAYISRSYISNIFKKATGETFNQYLTKVRMEKARSLILGGNHLVYEVAEKVGYRNLPYFSTLFRKYIGVNPSDLK